MAFFDMSLEQLEKYNPDVPEPADWDAFWQRTLQETAAYPLKPVFEPVDYCLTNVEVFDVSFGGYKGQTIKGWLILPVQRAAKLPCVVEYIGYGGGRGFPFDWLVWANAGFAHFVMDTRGQGSGWSKGDTPDEDGAGNNPHFPGFMTQGILAPETYYYRRLITDAVRAVQAAASHPVVDASKILLTGGSQGGALSLAVSGLVPDIKATMPDVPFLCHFRRATEITNSYPYQEIANYCKIHRDKIETVFRNLAYFDNLHFAKRAKCQALFSVSLMDDICPPSTVFAAYNRFGGKKEIRVYTYNNHEGGGPYQVHERLKYARSLVK